MLNSLADDTIHAFSSGIARVGLLTHFLFEKFPTHSSFYPEFLSGDSTIDECEPLFKKYKSCLSVIAFQNQQDFLRTFSVVN